MITGERTQPELDIVPLEDIANSISDLRAEMHDIPRHIFYDHSLVRTEEDLAARHKWDDITTKLKGLRAEAGATITAELFRADDEESFSGIYRQLFMGEFDFPGLLEHESESNELFRRVIEAAASLVVDADDPVTRSLNLAKQINDNNALLNNEVRPAMRTKAGKGASRVIESLSSGSRTMSILASRIDPQNGPGQLLGENGNDMDAAILRVAIDVYSALKTRETNLWSAVIMADPEEVPDFLLPQLVSRIAELGISDAFADYGKEPKRTELHDYALRSAKHMIEHAANHGSMVADSISSTIHGRKISHSDIINIANALIRHSDADDSLKGLEELDSKSIGNFSAATIRIAAFLSRDGLKDAETAKILGYGDLASQLNSQALAKGEGGEVDV
ncbi:MAG: hypothetical protein R3313_02855, partial [Candidatus Saccharimonadales bacterium]|nr:hypothetical protein [Candidatus Saccharimonadales bacterium]